MTTRTLDSEVALDAGSQPDSREPAPTPSEPASLASVRPVVPLPWSLLCLAVVALVLSWLHLTQGAVELSTGEFVRNLFSTTDQVGHAIAMGRLPRWSAAILVGWCLGAAGAALQSLTRNSLVSPDTVAVNAGAHAALTTVAAFGISVGTIGGGLVGMVGGLAAAGLTLFLSRRSGGPAGLVLVGSVIALALSSMTSVLFILRSKETQGLFAWGAGSLSQPGATAIVQMVPVAIIGVAALAVSGRWLDLLQLGDEPARALGVPVRSVKAVVVVLSVMLAAAAVTVAGPIGFVGLCAPALAALLYRGSFRGKLLLSLALGAVLILAADVSLRALLVHVPEVAEIPTGVATSLLGAVFLVWLSAGMRAGRADATAASHAHGPRLTQRHPAVVAVVLGCLVVAAPALGLLLGDGWLLMGDVWNWVSQVAPPGIGFILDSRAPRVLAGLLAGAALALAGATTQAITRNPLADPGLLGVSGGAGLGAVLALVVVPGAGFSGVTIGALIGAVVTAAVVMLVSARSGFEPTRLVLVGVGVSAATAALTTMVVVMSDPWNQTKAITWLGGSSYGATFPRLIVLAIVLVVSLAGLLVWHRHLDVLQLDADTPRLLGLNLPRSRVVLLVVAVTLTAAATAAVGVIGFIGLVAPHAARVLVGPLHRRSLPVAVLLGALICSLAETFGRSLLAPSQVPVGLVCALIGAPLFIALLTRSTR